MVVKRHVRFVVEMERHSHTPPRYTSQAHLDPFSLMGPLSNLRAYRSIEVGSPVFVALKREFSTTDTAENENTTCVIIRLSTSVRAQRELKNRRSWPDFELSPPVDP